MKYTIEAYDALVTNLKIQIRELSDKLDEECGTNSTIILGLLEYIASNLDLKSAMEIAKKYDAQFPDEQLVRYVKEDLKAKYD
jgi:hypothetical protein